MSNYMVRHGIISFGHILNDEETISMKDFAMQIKEHYDLKNRQTLFVFNLLSNLTGHITREGERFYFNYNNKQLPRAFKAAQAAKQKEDE